MADYFYSIQQFAGRLGNLIVLPGFNPLLVGQIAAHTGANHTRMQEVCHVVLVDAADSQQLYVADGRPDGLDIGNAQISRREQLDKVRSGQMGGHDLRGSHGTGQGHQSQLPGPVDHIHVDIRRDDVLCASRAASSTSSGVVTVPAPTIIFPA